jgi:hypothetical protein
MEYVFQKKSAQRSTGLAFCGDPQPVNHIIGNHFPLVIFVNPNHDPRPFIVGSDFLTDFLDRCSCIGTQKCTQFTRLSHFSFLL